MTKHKRNSIYADKDFFRKIIRIMVPVALQSLMLAAVAAGDAVMLGRIEQDSMAAVSLATQVQFVQNMIIAAIVSTETILGAQYWGKGDKKTINAVFFMSLRWVGVVSVLFCAACVVFPEYLMMIFTNEPALIRIGTGYLKIAGWSYLITGISQCYLGLMKITEKVSQSAWISSVAVVINIVLNAVFIFGLFGVPSMGANGAALATLLARVIELILAVSASRKNYKSMDFREFSSRNAALTNDFVKCVFPLIGSSLFWGVGFASYSAIIGHMGSDASAANSVSAVIRDLMCCLCAGISTAGGIVVGNELGSGNLERGKIYGNRLVKLSFLCGFFSMAVVLAVTPFVIDFMVLTEKARYYLIGMQIIMAVYMIGRSVNTIVINGIFAAGGDTLFDMYSLAVCMWGLAIPLAILGAFVFHWPVFAVYACTCLDELGKIPWVMMHYRKYKWVKDLTRDMA